MFLYTGALERIWSQLKFSSKNLVATPAQGSASQLLAEHLSAFQIPEQAKQLACSNTGALERI